MPKPKLKQTEIGTIPEDWESKKLEDVGLFRYGYTATSIQEDTGVKYIRITDISENGSIDWENMPFCKISNEEFEKYKINEGDILFARIGATAGKTCYIESKKDAAFASYLIRFQVKHGTNSKFVYFFTQSSLYWSQALRLREGQLKKGLNANTLAEIEILLPSELEQNTIVNILSTVDRRIDIVERERRAIERLKVGIMRELFAGKDWKIAKLGDENLFELIMGQSPPSSSYNREGKGLPFLQGNAEFGPISPNPTVYCSMPLKVAKSGDVLISVRAPVGELNIADKDCCIGRGIGAIRAKSGISNIFLFYYLKFINRKINSMAGGSTFKAVTKSQLERFEITIPSLQEQERIAEILSNLDKKLSIQQFKKLKLEMIKKGLMNNLLSGNKRIRVEKFLGEEK